MQVGFGRLYQRLKFRDWSATRVRPDLLAFGNPESTCVRPTNQINTDHRRVDQDLRPHEVDTGRTTGHLQKRDLRLRVARYY